MSSDDEQSDASSENNDLETTGLIATRAKRSTAGNLYASLRANLDDEELQKELLAEDEEEDAADYEGSDKADDDDDALESSSEEEDAGPPQEGQPEDLAGEAELKKMERKEQRQKRKAKDARLKLPAWQQKKKVKLADDVKTEDGAPVDRPKKKSERSNWLPTADDAPTRQSDRKLAVANREIIHANLKQSYERSEKQRRVMKVAAEREKAKKRANLTQEERMKMCEKIERQTAKEFGRWEREEAERQRVRDEILAAKRQRGLEGPVVRMWSGSAAWAGPRMVEGRCEHGSKDVNAKGDVGAPSLDKSKEDEGAPPETLTDGALGTTSNTPTNSLPDFKVSQDALAQQPVHDPVQAGQTTQTSDFITPATAAHDSADKTQIPASSETLVPLVHGIQDYAMPDAPGSSPSDTAQVPTTNDHPSQAPRVATTENMSDPQQAPVHPASKTPVLEHFQSTSNTQPSAQQHHQQPYTAWPNGTVPPVPPQFGQLTPFSTLAPALPPAPVLREQAQRSLIILEQFHELENSGTTKRNTRAANTSLEPTAVASVILPDSYPSFSQEESKYLTAKLKRSRGEYILAPAPPKQLCAITSWAAKYRDPKTGLCYADMHIYKIIQRVLADGCQWSGMLGCWVGPAYGNMGRPARGVPEGFTGPPPSAITHSKESAVEAEKAADPKA